MKFISLFLENIRSYTNQKLHFPDGILVLSGDIGSGKSTILLAIEFALFGVLRSELPGAALLRHGALRGSVELTFEVNGKQYTIKRSLKRSKTSVEQEAGYLIVDGMKKDATALELKSEIINLLGYPPEYITKSKNFVYRYTVYTPQEDIKQIIAESPETRVGLLRKVFDIEKYERIRQNASGFTRVLREKKRGFEFALTDEGEKKQRTEELKSSLAQINQEVLSKEEVLLAKRKQVNVEKASLIQAEQQKAKHDQLKQQVTLLTTQITSKQQEQARHEQEVKTLQESIAQETLPESIPNVDEIKGKITAMQSVLLQADQQIVDVNRKVTEQQTLKGHAERTVTKMQSLSTCPTCLQDVSDNHKHTIVKGEQEKIGTIHSAVKEHETTLLQLQEQKKKTQEEIEQHRKIEQEAMILSVKVKHHEERKQRKTQLDTALAATMQQITVLNEQQKSLHTELEGMKHIAELYEAQKKKVDALMQEERSLAIEHSTKLAQSKGIQDQIALLEQDLERKKLIRMQMEENNKQHHWLQEFFTPLMDVMEKHVLAKIHNEFDSLFQQWFSMLVEDTLMTARLDDSFTPIVQQNGYDVDVAHLSGGERTACALAYRLALNKTINSVMNTINTKDVLILDEPTEGFSTQQLDRLRDVLEQVQLKQVIIVSHEPKIESFADEIIRIEKTGHMSALTN